MVKFGKLLGKNMSMNHILEHQIFDVEIQFKEKLTSMENDSVKLEMEIEVLREEKADTLAQIIETERQIHLWERKIELQEQMQKIIKPDSGLKEIDDMKSYIHRQKLLYKKLQAEQEEVIKNMERSVQRRDFIKVRYPVDEFGTNNVKQKVNKSKEINELMEQINHIGKKKKDYSTKINTSKGAYDEINSNLNMLDNESFTIQSNALELRNEYFKEKVKTNNLFCKTKQYQDGTKMIDDYLNKKLKTKTQDAIVVELDSLQKENDMLIENIEELQGYT